MCPAVPPGSPYEFFDTVRPAATLVEVSRLIDPEMLVEIEADVVIDPDKYLR